MTGVTPPRTILFVRHGQTEWAAQRRHTGRTDLPLTEDGEVEAASAGGVLLSLLGIDEPTVVYSSPRIRARRTAALAFGRSEELVLTDLIAEFDYGDYEGLTSAQIVAERPGWDLWRDGCPNGETAAQVFARADAFIARCSAEAPGGVVVAFTHGHMSRALVTRFLGLGTELAAELHNDTASIAELRTRDGRLALTGWNLRPHGAAVRVA